ncbi:MAG: hypothetical protein AAF754_07130 [Pseudomonadota bacterium]
MQFETKVLNATSVPHWDGVDPTFLNYHAWQFRWADPRKSEHMALAVLQYSRSPGPDASRGARRRNGLAFRTLGWLGLWRGDFDAAEAYAHKALARLKGVGAESALIDAFDVLSVVSISKNDLMRADTYMNAADELLSKTDKHEAVLGHLVTKSVFERLTGRLQTAQKLSERVMETALGHVRNRAKLNLARALVSMGNHAHAQEHIGVSLQLCEDLSNKVMLPYAIEVDAQVKIKLDQTDGVADQIDRAWALANARNDRRAECHLSRQRAELTYVQGDRPAALELFVAALKNARDLHYPLLETDMLRRCAELQEELGLTDAALESMKALDRIKTQYSVPPI